MRASPILWIARYLLLSVALATTASCGPEALTVRGVVSVDGVAVDQGTIHLRPADQPAARGVGSSIQSGAFAFTEGSLPPGKYLATVVAFKKTGRKINDAMLGEVEETVQLKLANPEQQVEVTADNSTDLKIVISARGPRGGPA